MIERYYNENNELAVLISPGFGIGWSTDNFIDELAWDKRIVEYWMNKHPKKEKMKTFLESIGYINVSMYGYDELEIHWISKGTAFYINNYDGSEYISTNVHIA